MEDTPEEIVRAIAAIRDYQAKLTDEQREELWVHIFDGYCRKCGAVSVDGRNWCCARER